MKQLEASSKPDPPTREDALSEGEPEVPGTRQSRAKEGARTAYEVREANDRCQAPHTDRSRQDERSPGWSRTGRTVQQQVSSGEDHEPGIHATGTQRLGSEAARQPTGRTAPDEATESAFAGDGS